LKQLWIYACNNAEQSIDSKDDLAYRSFSEDDLDVPYEPTPQPVVEEMLKLAEVKK
jgi:hypothetical protein